MKTIQNLTRLLELVKETGNVDYYSVDLEFDIFENCECEREEKGYVVKDFTNEISLVEGGNSTYFTLTENVTELVNSFDEFYGNN